MISKRHDEILSSKERIRASLDVVPKRHKLFFQFDVVSTPGKTYLRTPPSMVPYRSIVLIFFLHHVDVVHRKHIKKSSRPTSTYVSTQHSRKRFPDLSFTHLIEIKDGTRYNTIHTPVLPPSFTRVNHPTTITVSTCPTWLALNLSSTLFRLFEPHQLPESHSTIALSSCVLNVVPWTCTGEGRLLPE